MAYVTYTAKREIEPTGFAKTGTDFSAIGSDDSFNAATTNLSGLLTDQWLQAAGFVKNAGWFQVKSNSTSAKILTLTPPVTHLRLPGVSGNSATTPDTAANSVTGDLDVRAKLSVPRWGNPIAEQYVFDKGDFGSQRSWGFGVGTNSALFLYCSSNGTAWLDGGANHASSVAVGAVDGAVLWIRATRASGSGTITYYTSSDGIVWTQLGTTVASTAGALFDSTVSLGVWNMDSANSGRLYYAELRNGINGTVVAAFDPTRGTRGAGSLVALTGETWTINTSGTPPALLQGPLLTYEGAEYLSLPGVAGNYASTPDSAAVSITGDIDIRARVSSNDWTPAVAETIMAKWGAAGQRSWILRLTTAGNLELLWSADGTATADTDTSTATVGFADGSVHWVRATEDVNNGAAGHDTKFYTSDDYDPTTGAGTWTQLGTTVTTAGTTSIFDSTAVVEMGSAVSGASSELLIGKVYYGELRNGLAGTVVAAFDPARAAAGATSLTAYTGEVWTINTSGSPAAALVRTTPVAITGYKRGYGQSYSIEFKAEQVDRKVKFKRNEQRPIGGGAAEVLFQYSDAVVDVMTEIFSEVSQVPQFREFLASVAAGEIFTFDRYGTIAVPVDPRQAQLVSVGYDEQRVMTTMQQRIPFSVRIVS